MGGLIAQGIARFGSWQIDIASLTLSQATGGASNTLTLFQVTSQSMMPTLPWPLKLPCALFSAF